jgi:hypothetical protein
MTDPKPCEHHFQFLGLVWNEGRLRPGSGSHETHISEKFHCVRCLVVEYRKTGERRDSCQKHDGMHLDRGAPTR